MKDLRILFVLQSPFSATLGMSKVHYDLKIAYESKGHSVDVLAYNDLYPNGQSPFSKIFGSLFTVEILKKLKKIAKNYDVIDANFDCVPYPKESFNFKGLLVYRSHGLQPLYRNFERQDPFNKVILEFQKKNKVKFKTRLGNVYRALQKKVGDKELYDSIKYADVVHCLNQDEYNFLFKKGVASHKMVILPNGISDKFILNATESKTSVKPNVLSFVASWTLRKGITDLNGILNNIKKKTAVDKLKLLGGVESTSNVKSFFEEKNKNNLDIIPKFDTSELSKLLNNVKVGIFPSYIEGFGLAIVEQLACGIPVVAYNVPGPKDILTELDSTLLIEPGNLVQFSKKVIEILNMPHEVYLNLSNKCKQRAKDYLMSKIADDFLELYNTKLAELAELAKKTN